MKRNYIAILLSIIVLIFLGIAFGEKKEKEPPTYTPIRIFDRNGEGTIMGGKIWRDTITATSESGMTIDISSAGFTVIGSVNVMALRNTATATEAPQVALKEVTTSTLTVNITQSSASLVTILGLSVLQGPAAIFATNVNTIKLYVIVIGK